VTVPPLVAQTNSFIRNLPEYTEELRNGDSFASDMVNRFNLEDRIDDLENTFKPDQIASASDPIINLLRGISSSLVSLLTVLVLAFFMLVEGPRWLKKYWSLNDPAHRDHRQQLAQRMYKVVTGYVNGQLLIASIAGVSTLIALLVVNALGFNIPFALPLAAIVSLLGLIPLIGATLGSLIVVAIALFSSVTGAIIMLVFFVVYQQIENNVLQPIVQSKSVNMSPLLIFISAIIGVNISGLLGAIVAIPVAASAKIVASDYLHRRQSQLERPVTKKSTTKKTKSSISKPK